MLFGEWKLEDALVLEREDGREEGREVGREEGREEGRVEGWEKGRDMVLELMEEGYTPKEIRAKLAAFQTDDA
jgi:predicted transposase YdaD